MGAQAGHRRLALVVVGVAIGLLATGLVTLQFWEKGTRRPIVSRVVPATEPPTSPPTTLPTPSTTLPPPPTTPPTSTTTVPPAPPTTNPTPGPVTLSGCPPPPHVPSPSHPWHPDVLVPESALPAPPPPAPRLANLAAINGKGMWIWQYPKTEGGDVAAIVRRAVAAQLTQLWVRVGSSHDGFYGTEFLNALVPAAHRQGLAVIGWGFPYLYDPGADATWTKSALAWKTPSGDRLDGWSSDIETEGEGTALSARRATAYLGLIRPHADGRPIVATVFPPTDYWLTVYPYQAMAPYVDAFAPMVYWGCREPGAAATSAVAGLSRLAPVHLIGQAYDMAPNGRTGAPSAAEISRFLDVARRTGANGASFWVWQEMTLPEWGALSSYLWPSKA